VDLRPTGETWPDAMAALLGRSVVRQILFEKRPGADKTQFAAEYIPELRQFIEAGPTQERPDSRQAAIVGQQAANSVALFCHSPEFQADEGFFV
jgi:hypothetical protein